MIVLSKAKRDISEKWADDIYTHLKQQASERAIIAYNTNFSLVKAGKKKQFTMKYIKARETQMFAVNYREIKVVANGLQLYPRKLGPNDSILPVAKRHLQWMKKNIGEITTCGHIMRTKNGIYYYNLSYEKKLDKAKPTLGGAVSMDPGVRTFLTTYHPQEMLESSEINSRIHAKFRRIDKLNRILSKVPDSKTRWNIRKKLRRIFAKVTEMVRDMHWKAASWLTDRYDAIIIPRFSGKQIAEKCKNHALNRIMLALSHFSFRQRLEHSCNLKGRTFIECTEEYTSKTCGRCGYIKEDLGSEKIYKCDQCKFVYGRDANGARNIMIKVLTEYLDKQGYRYNPSVGVSVNTN